VICNPNPNPKIFNGINHLEKHVRDLIKPLVNPRLICILMKINKIPLWQGLISMAGLRKLLECKWSPEVSNQYDSINNTLILTTNLLDDGRDF